jgi:XTP/dITP diphosphohydrolase
MKIVLASSNSGKIREIKEYYQEYEVVAYSDILGKFEIVENRDTFVENATLKAKAVQNRLTNLDDIVILADDSGITVPAIGGAPGVYSARYAREGATDLDNLNRLISTLKTKGIKKTPAFYTAAMVLLSKDTIQSVHGWMYGYVIDEARGSRGFGYDPMFIPEGFNNTLGELDDEAKKRVSHRVKALNLIKKLI